MVSNVPKTRPAYRFISAEKARTPVFMACRLLGVSRSGYYVWAANVPSARAEQDSELIERILEIHGKHRRVYGSPRIHAELAIEHGIRIGRKRVERLMREANISGMVRRKRGQYGERGRALLRIVRTDQG